MELIRSAGGEEAALFAGDLFRMYQRYFWGVLQGRSGKMRNDNIRKGFTRVLDDLDPLN